MKIIWFAELNVVDQNCIIQVKDATSFFEIIKIYILKLYRNLKIWINHTINSIVCDKPRRGRMNLERSILSLKIYIFFYHAILFLHPLFNASFNTQKHFKGGGGGGEVEDRRILR